MPGLGAGAVQATLRDAQNRRRFRGLETRREDALPEVAVRKRIGKRSETTAYRLSRWYYRRRPRVAIVVAFLAACIIGLVMAAGQANKSPPPPIEEMTLEALPQ